MSSATTKPHSEAVTFGHTPGGKVTVTREGAEATGPSGEFVAVFATLKAARKALFDLHMASEAGQRAA